MFKAMPLRGRQASDDPSAVGAKPRIVRAKRARAMPPCLSLVFGLTVALLLVVMAALAPYLTPHDPLVIDLPARLQPPSLGAGPAAVHLLGTDELGRDVLSRVIYGTRITLCVGFIAVFLGGLIGIAAGVISGYFGGFVDRLVMRVADIQLSLPLMLLALLVVAALGPSLENMILVLSLTSWVRYARIVRGQVLVVRSRDFISAAHAIGASDVRIMTRHILPNVVGPAIVVGTLELGRLIVMEASLSFLGLGVQPPYADWGLMLAQGRVYISSAWWVSTFPGLAIVLTVLAANLLGDWLRDRFDPRGRAQ